MAGLIPQHFINELLDRTDIVDVIESRMTLRKSGRNYSGLCPFHQEKTPSFSVNPEKQFYYCFGCSAGGNALGFVMEFDRLDFPTAVAELARKAGLEVPQETGANTQRNKQKETLYKPLTAAQQWYQQQLKSHPGRERAVAYLKGRGLSGEIAKQFAIGYAPPGWSNLYDALVDADITEKQLIEVGLLINRDDDQDTNAQNSAESDANDTMAEAKPARQRRSYDRFRNRIIFPIRDSRGRTIAFGGRVLDDSKPKYLNSPESEVFHKSQELYGVYEARQASNRLTRFIIVEGYMDVVALAQQGITYAVATLGTATSSAHLNKLFRSVPELIFSFDGDAAGRKAATRALETALEVMEDGRQIKFLFLPEGEDPDSLVRSQGKDAFLALLDQATPLPEFFFDNLCKDLDISSLDGKARLSKLAMPQLARLPKGVLYQLMLERLAQLTGLSVPQLSELTEKQAAQQAKQQRTQPSHDKPASANPDAWQPRRPARRKSHREIDSFARRAIKLLLQAPEVAALADNLEQLRNIDEDETQLLVAILDILTEQPKLNAAVIVSHWHGKPEYSDLVGLASREKLLLEAGDLETEFRDVIAKLAQYGQQLSFEGLHQAILDGTASAEQKLQYRESLARKSKQSQPE